MEMSVKMINAIYLRRFEKNDVDGYFNTRGDLRDQCPPDRLDTCNGFVCPRKITCTTSVRGVGLAMTCRTNSSELDLRDPANQGKPVFDIRLSASDEANEPWLHLTTLYNNRTLDNCIAEIISETCDIRTTMVDYRVVLRWGNITHLGHRGLNPAQPYQSPNDKFSLNGHAVGQLEEGGPLAGLLAVFAPYYETIATLRSPTVFGAEGLGTDRFFHGTRSSNPELRTNTFMPPSEIIYDKMAQYLFIALQFSAQTYQIVSADEEYPILVHKLDRQYVVVSLTVMAVGVISTAALFWGFWELERPVTLSPAETAKALDAPLLATTSDARTAEEVLEETGRRRIRYDGRVFRGAGGSGMLPLDGIVSVNGLPRSAAAPTSTRLMDDPPGWGQND